jgi:hypothetical protein
MNALTQQDVPVVIEGDGVEVRVEEIGGGMWSRPGDRKRAGTTKAQVC